MYVHKELEKNAEQALINYANNGGTLIVLHHGIASAKMKNPAWLDFVGIRLNPPQTDHGWKVLSQTTHTMVNLAPDHFITSNKINYNKVVDFVTNDSEVFSGNYQAFDLLDTEIFMNQQFADKSKKVVLYGFISGDGKEMQPTSAWYQKTGKGWLFYFQAGHQIADFENKNFSQIILNTLNWKP
jgi:type 1 glutamine amidotransferase